MRVLPASLAKSFLLAWAGLFLACAAAEEEPAPPPAAAPAGGDAPEVAPLRFRRVYAPADQMQELPRQGTRYVPMAPAEFERLAGRSGEADGASPAPRLAAATYSARLVEDVLEGGEATLVILRPPGTPAAFPLEPLNLAVAKAAWKGPQGTPADLGQRGGRLVLNAQRADDLWLSWSLRGKRHADGTLDFRFELPPCAAIQLALELPAALRPLAEGVVIVGEGDAAGGGRRWRLLPGGKNRFTLRLAADADRAPGGPRGQLRQTTVYRLAPRGIDIAAAWSLTVRGAPLRQLAVVLDPGVQLLSASCGDAALRWSAASGGGPAEKTQLILEVPGVEGFDRVVRLQAVAPLELDRPQTLPRLTAPELLWQEGKAALLVATPLALGELTPLDSRQTHVEPLAAPESGEAIELEHLSAGGTARFVATRPRRPPAVDSATVVALAPAAVTARIAAALRQNEGECFAVAARVGDGWTIEDVQALPDDALDHWEVAETKAADGKTARTLAVGLAKAVRPGRPVQLTIAARAAPPQGRLGLAKLVPLEFEAAEGRRLLGLRAARPHALSLSGAEGLTRLDPARLEPADQALLGPDPPDALFALDAAAAGLQAALSGPGAAPAAEPPSDPRRPEHPAPGAAPAPEAQQPGAAWAWDCRLQSDYAADGEACHLLTCRLENHGRAALAVQLPSAAIGLSSSMAWVDGQRVSAAASSSEETLTIPLPVGRRFPVVCLRFQTRGGGLGRASVLRCPLPTPDLPVLGGSWTVTLPEGYEVEGGLLAPVRGSAGGGWVRKLLGPLAAPADEAPFNPFRADDWRDITGRAAPHEANGRQQASPRGSTRRSADAGPWDVTESAGESRPGPSRTEYHLDLGGGEPPELRVIHRDALRGLSWGSFLMVFAAAVFWRARRWRGLAAAAATAALGALLLPATASAAASGALVGLLAAMGVKALAAPGGGDEATDADAPSRCRTHAAATATAILLAALAGVAAAADPAPAARTAPVYNVYIPIGDDEKPSGEKYLVPEELYSHLERRASARDAQPGSWTLLSARYQGGLEWDASGRLVCSAVKALFELQVTARGTRVRLPLGGQGWALAPGGALLDGQAIPADADAARREVALEVAEPGRYRLELTLSPQAARGRGEPLVDIVIPRLATAELELPLPTDAPPLEVSSARGACRIQKDPPRLSAELGPAPRLTVRCLEEGRGRAPAQVEVEELLWLKVQPGAVVLDAVFHGKVAQGRTRGLELAVDPRLRLTPADDGRTALVRPPPEGELLKRVRFPLASTAEPFVLSASFLVTEASGVGNLPLPLVEPTGARVTRRWLAVSVDAGLQARESGGGARPLGTAEFLARWGRAKQPPSFVRELPPGGGDWSLNTSPLPPQVKADESLSLSFAEGRVEALLECTIDIRRAPVFQYRIAAPPQFEVLRAEVTQDSAPRAARWSRAADGAVVVFLKGPALGTQQLTVHGRCPLAAGPGPRVPAIRLEGAAAGQRRLHVFRQADVRLRLDPGKDARRDDAPPSAEAKRLGFGRLAGSYAGRQTSSTLGVAVLPNRPQVRADAQITLRPQATAWTLEVDVRAMVRDGVLDEFRFRFPAWCGQFKSDRPDATLSTESGNGTARQVILRPEAAVSGEYRFHLACPIRWPAGSRPTLPEIVPMFVPGPVGAAEVASRVLLPAEVSGEAVSWETRGLESDGDSPGPWGPPPLGLAAYRVKSFPYAATVEQGNHCAAASRVVLADCRASWSGGETWRGLACFDVTPPGATPVRLRVPDGLRVLQVRVNGASLPAAADGAPLREIALDGAGLPQRVEVLFTAAAADAGRGARTFEAPFLEDLPVQTTLWTFDGPRGGTLRDAEPSQPLDSSLRRLRSAAEMLGASGDGAADAPRAASSAALWRRWKRSAADARREIARAGPSEAARAAGIELAALEARVRGAAAPGGDTPADAIEPADLWPAPQAPVGTLCAAAAGAMPALTIAEASPAIAPALWRILEALALAALGVGGVLAVRRGYVATVARRWPYLFGVALGAAWWWWMAPSFLGVLIVLASAAVGARRSWRAAHPAGRSGSTILRGRP